MALVLLIGLVSVLFTSTCGLNLTSPSSEYQAALGHDISLRCHFTLASVDVGDLEIEWTVNRSDGQEEEEHLICYTENVLHHFTGFEGRVHFSSPDPQDGDASLTIKRVKITDKGTYQCTVKKFREVQSSQIKLMVMEEVPVPVYGSDGGTESDVDLKLRNKSSLITTFPANYSLLPSTETSASSHDDLSSQDNAKTTTGTTTVITTGTITGTYPHTLQATTVVVMMSVFNQVFGMVHDTAETHTVHLNLTTESQNTSSLDGAVSIAVAVPITFIIIISAGIIFRCWKQKKQQKSDEENVSADEERFVPAQPEMITVMKEFDVAVITVPVL
uniref:coxsackievirus and adenovirus receptor homolog n=1 Tax=Scatophagus argus TaxID=75038 RepID=UPI001ED85442|nr:coxsackievirus and adenovirus receptor homolog [Scatophagus argus]